MTGAGRNARALWMHAFICSYSDSIQCLSSGVGIAHSFQRGGVCGRGSFKRCLNITCLDAELRS